jgi:hypothetical protein
VRIVDDCRRARRVQVIGLKAGIDGDDQEQEVCEGGGGDRDCMAAERNEDGKIGWHGKVANLHYFYFR